MKNYKALIENILTNGEERNDRTGVGTLSVFSPEPLRFDLTHRFPLLTLKYTSFKNILAETLWFLSGKCDNTDYLKKHGVTIWDEWAGFANMPNNLGLIYGVQWRAWSNQDFIQNKVVSYDQIKELISGLKNNPTSRRHIVTAWNVTELKYMALPPCHWAFQCYVSNDNRLSLKLFQRSSDTFLGLPYNIAGYALITHILANICGLQVGELIVDIGDAHLYKNHLNQARIMVERPILELPKLVIKKQLTLEDLNALHPPNKEIFEVVGYVSHPAIKGEVAV